MFNICSTPTTFSTPTYLSYIRRLHVYSLKKNCHKLRFNHLITSSRFIQVLLNDLILSLIDLHMKEAKVVWNNRNRLVDLILCSKIINMFLLGWVSTIGILNLSYMIPRCDHAQCPRRIMGITGWDPSISKPQSVTCWHPSIFLCQFKYIH